MSWLCNGLAGKSHVNCDVGGVDMSGGGGRKHGGPKRGVTEI